MTDFDTLFLNANLATFCGEGYGEIRDGALAIANGKIVWLGPRNALPSGWAASTDKIIDAKGGWITPGLIDCHTHLVYGSNRAAEWEMRLEGASYEEIARAGGGIRSTVSATRAADERVLLSQAWSRAQALASEGVTTVEIKSGYGLDTDSEARMLRVARRIGDSGQLAVRTTFLGAHALPAEFAGRADDYIDHLCQHMLPAIAAEGLADAVDAFCETIGFSPAQTERVFQRAQELNLPVKLHAEQLSNQGGAALVARFQGLSADHIEWLDEAGIAAMKRAGTVAVLLPGAFYCLRETKVPPIDALRAAGVPMAVATDHNPGTAPLLSLRLAMNMACTLFRLTPAEALAGATRHAAAALGLNDRGRLEVGLRADLCVWQVERPAELIYQIGGQPLRMRYLEGRQL
ncbi:imidazolonepropionase [Parachitinimonas caeni]|uniref:Imidazolonepropionase n=1 Tax=Parachitinimonas caeni TaxID=3031301 RepID=A0ABT7DX34_9NEIS|nr:imidazolonepropionase [Parachitinimonas caeni]MDK2124544.1 imidazolonepropionase [Parachitinimonas caeni]